MAISELVEKCLNLFRSLSLLHSELKRESIARQVDDDRVRFSSWADSLGARKSSGRDSLEWRLRDSERIYTRTDRLLKKLRANLEDAANLRSDSVLDGVSESDDDLAGIEYDVDHSSLLDQRMRDIRETVDLLVRLSTTLANPARLDRGSWFSSTQEAGQTFDIDHVKLRFPSAPRYLIERLGRAITRRRCYLRYRRERYSSKTTYSDSLDADESRSTSTVVTLSNGVDIITSGTSVVSLDPVARSVTAASVEAPRPINISTLKVPPIPEAAAEHEDDFQCPVCYGSTTVSNDAAWRRHVFEDLTPYHCTVQSCPNANVGFATRKEWTTHHEQAHDRVWVCPFECSATYEAAEGLEDHLRSRHAQNHDDETLQRLSGACSEPAGKLADLRCPLCQGLTSSSQEWYRHVGDHFQQLALFSLPPELLVAATDDEDESSETETRPTRKRRGVRRASNARSRSRRVEVPFVRRQEEEEEEEGEEAQPFLSRAPSPPPREVDDGAPGDYPVQPGLSEFLKAQRSFLREKPSADAMSVAVTSTYESLPPSDPVHRPPIIQEIITHHRHIEHPPETAHPTLSPRDDGTNTSRRLPDLRKESSAHTLYYPAEANQAQTPKPLRAESFYEPPEVQSLRRSDSELFGDLKDEERTFRVPLAPSVKGQSPPPAPPDPIPTPDRATVSPMASHKDISPPHPEVQKASETVNHFDETEIKAREGSRLRVTPEGPKQQPSRSPSLDNASERSFATAQPSYDYELRLPPVTFRDDWGNPFKFPFHQVKTWPGLKSMMESVCAGNEWMQTCVRENRFWLWDVDGTPQPSVILPEAWESTVRPMMLVQMQLWRWPAEGERQDRSQNQRTATATTTTGSGGKKTSADNKSSKGERRGRFTTDPSPSRIMTTDSSGDGNATPRVHKAGPRHERPAIMSKPEPEEMPWRRRGGGNNHPPPPPSSWQNSAREYADLFAATNGGYKSPGRYERDAFVPAERPSMVPKGKEADDNATPLWSVSPLRGRSPVVAVAEIHLDERRGRSGNPGNGEDDDSGSSRLEGEIYGKALREAEKAVADSNRYLDRHFFPPPSENQPVEEQSAAEEAPGVRWFTGNREQSGKSQKDVAQKPLSEKQIELPEPPPYQLAAEEQTEDDPWGGFIPKNIGKKKRARGTDEELSGTTEWTFEEGIAPAIAGDNDKNVWGEWASGGDETKKQDAIAAVFQPQQREPEPVAEIPAPPADDDWGSFATAGKKKKKKDKKRDGLEQESQPQQAVEALEPPRDEAAEDSRDDRPDVVFERDAHSETADLMTFEEIAKTHDRPEPRREKKDLEIPTAETAPTKEWDGAAGLTDQRLDMNLAQVQNKASLLELVEDTIRKILLPDMDAIKSDRQLGMRQLDVSKGTVDAAADDEWWEAPAPGKDKDVGGERGPDGTDDGEDLPWEEYVAEELFPPDVGVPPGLWLEKDAGDGNFPDEPTFQESEEEEGGVSTSRGSTDAAREAAVASRESMDAAREATVAAEEQPEDWYQIEVEQSSGQPVIVVNKQPVQTETLDTTRSKFGASEQAFQILENSFKNDQSSRPTTAKKSEVSPQETPPPTPNREASRRTAPPIQRHQTSIYQGSLTRPAAVEEVQARPSTPPQRTEREDPSLFERSPPVPPKAEARGLDDSPTEKQVEATEKAAEARHEDAPGTSPSEQRANIGQTRSHQIPRKPLQSGRPVDAMGSESPVLPVAAAITNESLTEALQDAVTRRSAAKARETQPARAQEVGKAQSIIQPVLRAADSRTAPALASESLQEVLLTPREIMRRRTELARRAGEEVERVRNDVQSPLPFASPQQPSGAGGSPSRRLDDPREENVSLKEIAQRRISSSMAKGDEPHRDKDGGKVKPAKDAVVRATSSKPASPQTRGDSGIAILGGDDDPPHHRQSLEEDHPSRRQMQRQDWTADEPTDAVAATTAPGSPITTLDHRGSSGSLITRDQLLSIHPAHRSEVVQAMSRELLPKSSYLLRSLQHQGSGSFSGSESFFDAQSQVEMESLKDDQRSVNTVIDLSSSSTSPAGGGKNSKVAAAGGSGSGSGSGSVGSSSPGSLRRTQRPRGSLRDIARKDREGVGRSSLGLEMGLLEEDGGGDGDSVRSFGSSGSVLGVVRKSEGSGTTGLRNSVAVEKEREGKGKEGERAVLSKRRV